MQKWTVCNKTGDFAGIMKKFNLSNVAARLLVNRNIVEDEAIREYLYPDNELLNPPQLIYNLNIAVNLITEKISENRKIRVIGDYDADGIMSTYILTETLQKLGASVDFYIPDRIRDGYGINSTMIIDAAKAGIDTIITCDNGIAACDAADEADKNGITLIVTDHHELPDVLPKARVIVDPKQPEDTYPCRDICGAVVAAKLSEELLAVSGICDRSKARTMFLEFMSMATICDVVPLEKENRVIAKLGIAKLNSLYMPLILKARENGDSFEKMAERLSVEDRAGINLGLLAIIFLCLSKNSEINDYSIGYVIGPCFNATGRLDMAERALRLLKAVSPNEAESSAVECIKLNEERKSMTNDYAEQAYQMLNGAECNDRVLIVELPDCHESIAGIIAGRIREKYSKPTIVFTKAQSGMKGSGRSIPAYNMFEELNACKDLFTKFGGHPMAAGLSLPEENVAELRRRLNENCKLTEDDMADKVVLDAAAGFNIFTLREVKEIEMFAPFGQGNRSVLFGERNLKVLKIGYIGKNASYLRFDVVNEFNYRYQIPYFKDRDEILSLLEKKYGKREVDAAFEGKDNLLRLTVAYTPKINTYRGDSYIQMSVCHIKV